MYVYGDKTRRQRSKLSSCAYSKTAFAVSSCAQHINPGTKSRACIKCAQRYLWLAHVRASTHAMHTAISRNKKLRPIHQTRRAQKKKNHGEHTASESRHHKSYNQNKRSARKTLRRTSMRNTGLEEEHEPPIEKHRSLEEHEPPNEDTSLKRSQEGHAPQKWHGKKNLRAAAKKMETLGRGGVCKTTRHNHST